MNDSTMPDRAKKPKRNRRWCAYCGQPRTTDDHVPPRGLFGELSPSEPVNLITVPSCAACNHPESKDDTYFRDALCVMASEDENTVPAGVRQQVRRSLAVAGSKYQTPSRTMMKMARPAWAQLGDSSLLQDAQTVPIRWDRVKRTVDRTVRGLYWHHWGVRMPAEFDVTVIGAKERATHGLYQVDLFHEMALDTLKGHRHIVHPKIFMYAVNFASDDSRMGSFVLAFYRRVNFMGVVGPPESPTPIVFPGLA